MQFPFWSIRTIQRTLLSLEEKGLLLVFLRNDFQRIKHYTIDYDQLYKMQLISIKIFSETTRQIDLMKHANLANSSRQFGRIDHDKMAPSYKGNTEITNRNNLSPLSSNNSFSNFIRKKEEDLEKNQKDKFLQNDFFQDCLNVWNELVQSKFSGSIYLLLNPIRIQKFIQFGNETSIENLDAWKRYCQKIGQSRFLMGENASGFRVTLEWALNPTNALKILEGAIYDKPREETKFSEKPWNEYIETLKQHCFVHGYSERWLNVCKALASRLGQATFESWFKAMIPEEQEEEIVYLTVASLFIRDYIKTHYLTALQQAFSVSFPQSTRFEIQIGTGPPGDP